MIGRLGSRGLSRRSKAIQISIIDEVVPALHHFCHERVVLIYQHSDLRPMEGDFSCVNMEAPWPGATESIVLGSFKLSRPTSFTSLAHGLGPTYFSTPAFHYCPTYTHALVIASALGS